jgi:hypothetical protein
MANVLNTDSTITCAFQGTAKTKSHAKLVVDNAPVLLAKDATTWTMSGCQQMTGNTKTPCVTLGSVTAGKAQKLNVNGSAVLLDTFKATTTAPPTAHTASASGGKSKVTAA